MKILAWMLREAKSLLALFFYFLFCYGIILLSKKLILEHYDISFFGLGTAVVGALIAAKAVLVIEGTPLSRVLRAASPWVKVLYDSLLYTVFALVILYVEKLVELARKEGGFRLAFLTEGREDHLNQFCVTLLWAGLSFLGYATFAAIRRHLGPGELFRIFTTPPGKGAPPRA